MAKHRLGSGSLAWNPIKHRSEEVRESLSFTLLDPVLLHEHLPEWPVVKSTDSPEVTLAVEELLGVLA